MAEAQSRYDLLRKFTSNYDVIKELLDYTSNKFVPADNLNNLSAKTFSDEMFISTWKDYSKEPKTNGVFDTLRSCRCIGNGI